MQNANHRSDQLHQHLIGQIKSTSQAAVPYSQFINEVLYAPELGYYQSNPFIIGEGGDFVTASVLSPVFSQVLARKFHSLLAGNQQPIILELGAGSGHFALEVVRYFSQIKDITNFQYWIVEPSESLRQLQQQFLRDQLEPEEWQTIEWLTELPISSFDGIVFANEVLDALPFDIYEYHHDQWRQLGVAYDDGEFYEQPMAGSFQFPEDFLSYIDGTGPWQPGQRIVYRSIVGPWLQSLQQNLVQGYIICIDYGQDKQSLIEHYPMGSMRCYYQQQVNDNIFERLGLQDITADVDFEDLIDQSLKLGLNLEEYCSQSHYLMGQELQDVLTEQPQHTTKTGLKQILLPTEMGERFKVVVFSK